MTEPHIVFIQTAVDCNHHPHVNKKWRLGVGECYEDVMLSVRLVMCSTSSPANNTPIALKLMLRTSEHSVHDLNTTVVMNPPNSVQEVEVKLRKTPKQTKSRIVGYLLNTTEDVCRVVPSNSLHILSRRTRTIRRVLKKSLGKESAAITPEKWLDPYSQQSSSSRSPNYEFLEDSSRDSSDSLLGKRSRDGYYSSSNDEPEPLPKARLGSDKRVLPPISSLIPQESTPELPHVYQVAPYQPQTVPIHPPTFSPYSQHLASWQEHSALHNPPLHAGTPNFASHPTAVNREY